jgi:hypothetical protein
MRNREKQWGEFMRIGQLERVKVLCKGEIIIDQLGRSSLLCLAVHAWGSLSEPAILKFYPSNFLVNSIASG